MMQNIYLLAFGTFGNPYGFRQSFIKYGNENVAKAIKTFDLNTNAIQVFPKSTLFSIRKELVNGLNAIAYSKYTFAKEQNSDRGGTFIGASIFFTNEIADEHLTISKLNEFHEILVRKNVTEDTISVTHSDNFSVELPKDFDKLDFNLKNIEEPLNYAISNTNLLVYAAIDAAALQHHFKKAMELLNYYDTIFFTNNEEIAKFTLSKRLYTVLDETKKEFTIAIQNLEEEKKQKLQILKKDLEREFKELEEKKRITLKEVRDDIEQNTKTHQANGKKIEESKKQIAVAETKYNQFSKKIKEAIQLLDSQQTIEAVKQFHQHNKNEFSNAIQHNRTPTYLKDIKDIQPKIQWTDAQYSSSVVMPSAVTVSGEANSVKKPFKIFKYVAFLFFTFWLATFIYYQYYKIPQMDEVINRQKNSVQPILVQKNPDQKASDSLMTLLTPKPNAQLEAIEIKRITENLNRNLTLKEVVNLVFTANPNEIKKPYTNQMDLYSKIILALNHDNFETLNGTTYYKQGPLQHIPSYKTEIKK